MKLSMKFYTVMALSLLFGCSETPNTPNIPEDTGITFEQGQVAEKLAGALRFETTYSQDAVPNTEAFTRLHTYLEETFPVAHQVLIRKKINELSLVYIWPGSDPTLKAVGFLSHQDVVPADEPDRWKEQPFSGVIKDGYIHGRGSVDVKFGITATLEAMEQLHVKGFRPKRTIFFAYGHDEEIMGTRGGEKIAQWMAQEGIAAEFILDEGPGVTQGLIPNIEAPIAFVGVAARGNIYFKISYEGEGGHGSFPPAVTPIGIINQALYRIDQHKFEQELTQPLVWSLEHLSSHIGGATGFVYKHNGLFSSLILKEIAKTDTGRSVSQNTLVATTIHSGDKDATVPSYAAATLAMGILPGETIESAHNALIKIIDDPRVVVEVIKFPDNQRDHAYNPTDISPADSQAYHAIKKSIRQIFPSAAIAPTLMPGGSDGKHYLKAGVTDKIYYFFPINVSEKELMSMHGVDEKLPIDAYGNSIRFYAQLIKNVQTL